MSRINLIARDNGFGLTRNLHLLESALIESGHQVQVSAIGRGKLRKLLRPLQQRAQIALQRWQGRDARRYDVNLMLEHVYLDYLPLARHNVLMPHPEWFAPEDAVVLPRMNRVFALTHHAVPIFERLQARVDYVGFTSVDRLDNQVPRERAFFHLAGRSPNKGTEPLLSLWRKHPEWPRLTVVQNPRAATPGTPAANIDHRLGYLSDSELQRLQNAHRFHICASETEGFGHYLVEAMSVGAITITLDAAPMNEMIDRERGILVPAARTGKQGLATTHFYDETAMQTAIQTVLATDEPALQRLGDAARHWFEDNDRQFQVRIAAALAALG